MGECGEADLSTSLIGQALPVAVVVGQRCASHAETGLQRPRRVVDPAVDHAAVVAALVEGWGWCGQTGGQIRGRRVKLWIDSQVQVGQTDRWTDRRTDSQTIGRYTGTGGADRQVDR